MLVSIVDLASAQACSPLANQLETSSPLATLILYCRGRSGGGGGARGGGELKGGAGGCPDPHESVDCHSLLLII